VSYLCIEIYYHTIIILDVTIAAIYSGENGFYANCLVLFFQYLFWETPFGSGLGSLIIGLTMVIGFITAIFLPETNNQKIPETIQEADSFMISSASTANRTRYSSNTCPTMFYKWLGSPSNLCEKCKVG
jgi:hypothetical protein